MCLGICSILVGIPRFCWKVGIGLVDGGGGRGGSASPWLIFPTFSPGRGNCSPQSQIAIFGQKKIRPLGGGEDLTYPLNPPMWRDYFGSSSGASYFTQGYLRFVVCDLLCGLQLLMAFRYMYIPMIQRDNTCMMVSQIWTWKCLLSVIYIRRNSVHIVLV